MKKELIIKKCMKCGAMVEVLKDCTCKDCGIKCCGENMKIIVANLADTDHIPTYEKVEDEIFVKVNHAMEKEHYIEWIAMVTDNIVSKVILYPEQNAECRFKYIPGSTIYIYCSEHGLSKYNVEVL